MSSVGTDTPAAVADASEQVSETPPAEPVTAAACHRCSTAWSRTRACLRRSDPKTMTRRTIFARNAETVDAAVAALRAAPSG